MEMDTIAAAALLGLSEKTLRKWRCTGEQPALRWYKRFSRVFYLLDDVESFRDSATSAGGFMS